MDEEKKNPIEVLMDRVKPLKSEPSLELFNSSDNDSDVDLKSDIVLIEDRFFSILAFNDRFLESIGLEPLTKDYRLDLLRIRFSLDRKSREEFVHTQSVPLQNMQFPSEFKSISEARK